MAADTTIEKTRFSGTTPRPADLCRLCQQKLRKSSYPSVRQVVCQLHEGLLTLRGTVPTYYEKQMAGVTIGNVPGVERFLNRIEVASDLQLTTQAQRSFDDQAFS